MSCTAKLSVAHKSKIDTHKSQLPLLTVSLISQEVINPLFIHTSLVIMNQHGGKLEYSTANSTRVWVLSMIRGYLPNCRDCAVVLGVLSALFVHGWALSITLLTCHNLKHKATEWRQYQYQQRIYSGYFTERTSIAELNHTLKFDVLCSRI